MSFGMLLGIVAVALAGLAGTVCAMAGGRER